MNENPPEDPRVSEAYRQADNDLRELRELAADPVLGAVARLQLRSLELTQREQQERGLQRELSKIEDPEVRAETEELVRSGEYSLRAAKQMAELKRESGKLGRRERDDDEGDDEPAPRRRRPAAERTGEDDREERRSMPRALTLQQYNEKLADDSVPIEQKIKLRRAAADGTLRIK